MCSESMLKDFQKITEVLPFNKYGLSSLEEFQSFEDDIHHLEWLKKAGLNSSEIKLYQDNETGKLDIHKNIEAGALKDKLNEIYKKINQQKNVAVSILQVSEDLKIKFKSHASNVIGTVSFGDIIKLSWIEKKGQEQEEPSTLNSDEATQPQTSKTMYPEGHPMNNIKDIEENLFSHLEQDMLPITKRRKILRHLERRKERILSEKNQPISKTVITGEVKPGSLWDVKELPQNSKQVISFIEQDSSHKYNEELPSTSSQKEKVIGPKKTTMYTIKDNKIVRLEPVDNETDEEYRAVDIVMPVNTAEEQLLEGTKMAIDDIKKIERFKDYEPGVPSKVLYLKNIAPAVTREQLSLLFNQFILENGGPIDIRLMSGRMRGQAFVAFTNEDIAIQALEETNGTILSGRPLIVQFGRNTNRIQEDDVR